MHRRRVALRKEADRIHRHTTPTRIFLRCALPAKTPHRRTERFTDVRAAQNEVARLLGHTTRTRTIALQATRAPKVMSVRTIKPARRRDNERMSHTSTNTRRIQRSASHHSQTWAQALFPHYSDTTRLSHTVPRPRSSSLAVESPAAANERAVVESPATANALTKNVNT